MSSANLYLNPLNLSNLPKDGIIFILGRRRSGKSTLVDDILYHRRKTPLVMAMSETEESNHFFSKRIPKGCIFTNFNSEAIGKLIRHQQKRVGKYGKCARTEALLIIDDCAANKNLSKDKNLRWLFVNGRQSNICLVLTSQVYKLIPPGLRGNIDYTFAFFNNIHEDVKTLHAHYFGIFKTWYHFNQVFKQATTNRHCLVVDHNVNEDDAVKCLYTFKATDRSNNPFIAGSPSLWASCKQQIERKNKEVENDNSNRKQGYENEAQKIIMSGKKDVALNVVRKRPTTVVNDLRPVPSRFHSSAMHQFKQTTMPSAYEPMSLRPTSRF